MALFQKGQSGNPGGRPTDPIRKLARQKSKEAFEVLAAIMADTEASDGDRIKAANSVLDRGFGKPVQLNAETDTDGNELEAGATQAGAMMQLAEAIVLLATSKERTPEINQILRRLNYAVDAAEAEAAKH